MRYFKERQFKKDSILIAVGYYCRFFLSYRDVSELLRARGIFVHPTTIMRWVHDYSNLLYRILKKKNKAADRAWHIDETYIKVKGKWCYLYRAIDSDGYTLDFQLRKTRNHQAPYAFMERLVEPSVLTTGKAPALLCAFKKLQKDDYYTQTKHCTIKHRNNLIEQDHRHVKRRFVKSAGFHTLRHASRTIKGIETIQAIYKQRRNLQTNFVFSVYNELQKLVATA
ncbi:IS6 family transposase [Bacillus thuringiensis]